MLISHNAMLDYIVLDCYTCILFDWYNNNNNYICTSVALNRYLKDASKNLEHYTSTHMHLLNPVIHFELIRPIIA